MKTIKKEYIQKLDNLIRQIERERAKREEAIVMRKNKIKIL